ncbi:MAG: thioredoxin domain-containing protein [Minicystis sp.]
MAACGGREFQPTGADPTGVAETIDLFAGIPQNGVVLGDPSAPVTLTEFIDLQCPYCRRFALEVLPSIIQRHVRAGQVKIVFRNLAFLGPDSKEAAQMTAAVGLQDHLWQFADLFLRNQGEENAGYVTDDFLRRLAAALPGVDVHRALNDRDAPAVARQLEDAEREAERFGIQSTPSFLLGKTGETPHVLAVSSLTPEPFTRAIDALLPASFRERGFDPTSGAATP